MGPHHRTQLRSPHETGDAGRPCEGCTTNYAVSIQTAPLALSVAYKPLLKHSDIDIWYFVLHNEVGGSAKHTTKDTVLTEPTTVFDAYGSSLRGLLRFIARPRFWTSSGSAVPQDP